MSKPTRIPEPTGLHPYRVIYRYLEPNPDGGLPIEKKAEAFYSANGKGNHNHVMRTFMIDNRRLKYQIISVDYLG